MSEQQNLFTKFYYPKCKEIGCSGLLNIKIRDNFTLEYECDADKNHNGKKIFFKTFERFYLKENEINKCSICCSFLDGDAFYKCKKCDNFYCLFCIKKDKHIKNGMNDIEIEGNKCKFHKKELNYYCTNCKKYICSLCLKIENAHDKSHIVNLIELMPTKEQIKKLKNKIKEKKDIYDEIIKSMDEW